MVTAVGSLAVTAAIQAKVKGVYSGLEGSQELADISEKKLDRNIKGVKQLLAILQAVRDGTEPPELDLDEDDLDSLSESERLLLERMFRLPTEESEE